MPAAASLTLVVPAYNAAGFLRGSLDQAWAWLRQLDRACELLVVDDGSSDATASVLAAFATAIGAPAVPASGGEPDATPLRAGAPVFRWLRNQRNRGKGFSLRRAFLHARGECVAFTDADLTYPIDNVQPLVQALEAGADVAIGSRMHPDSRYVVAPSFFGKLFSRHFMGRVFNLLVRALVVPRVYDTQAGLKGFQRAAAQMLAERVRLDRFSFDVELLFLARRAGLRIDECPVLFLYRKEPSTVRFARDSWAMFRDMLRIRWRAFRRVYDAPTDPAVRADLLYGGPPPDAAAVPPARRPGLGQTG